MLCLVTSILAVLLSVSDYGAVLPWVTGMLISGVSVWERIRSAADAGKPHAIDNHQHAQKKGAAGLLPPRPNFVLAGPGLRAPRCQAVNLKA